MYNLKINFITTDDLSRDFVTSRYLINLIYANFTIRLTARYFIQLRYALTLPG